MTSTTSPTASPAAEPRRARAVFSTEDFRLLRAALLSHMQRADVQDGPESIRYGHLYHRLGALGAGDAR